MLVLIGLLGGVYWGLLKHAKETMEKYELWSSETDDKQEKIFYKEQSMHYRRLAYTTVLFILLTVAIIFAPIVAFY